MSKVTPGGIESGALPMFEERCGLVVKDLEIGVRWTRGVEVRMHDIILGACILFETVYRCCRQWSNSRGMAVAMVSTSGLLSV